jgi:hypothetical protein
LDRIGHPKANGSTGTVSPKKKKYPSRIGKIKAEEKVLREEMCMLHANESSCHKVTSGLVEIRKIVNFRRGFRDEGDTGLVPEGDMDHVFFEDTVGSLASNILAWIEDLRCDFRALFSELSNFWEECEYAITLDATGNLSDFDDKMGDQDRLSEEMDKKNGIQETILV